MYKVFLAIFLFPFLSIFAEELPDSDSVRVYKAPSITVTSTRAKGKQSPVPYSEITEVDIQKDYTISDLPVYMNNMPSVLTYSQSGNGIGYSNMSMRGFDQRRIAVMINGIPQNDPEDHQVYWIDFPDLAESVSEIQIQRGAGLMNYGAAAIGGSVNLMTSNYVNKRQVRVHTGMGFQEFGENSIIQNTMGKYLFEFSSGLIENYAFYGRLSKVNSLGYRDRSGANMNSYFLSAVKFDETVTTQVNIFGGPLTDELVYNGLPKSYMSDLALRRKNYATDAWAYDSTGKNLAYYVDRRPQEIEEFSQPHFEILNDWEISSNLIFKSALFYYTGDGYFDFDGSWADAEMFRLTPENGWENAENPVNALIRANVSNKQGGWIPRIILDHDNGMMTLGAEIRIHQSAHWGKIRYAELLPENYDPDYKFYSYNGIRNIMSLFGREEYRLNENWRLTGELQFVYHNFGIENEKAGNLFTEYQTINGETIGNGNRLFDNNFFFLNPRIGLTHNINENNTVYTSLAYTSREPRMRNLYAASDSYFGSVPQFESDTVNGVQRFDFTKPLVKPESMLDFELGWRFGNENYSASANIYMMEYFDELVKSGQLDIFGSPVDGNAPRTRHWGIELEGKLYLMKSASANLSVYANATYSKNTILEYDFRSSTGEIISLADNQIAGFPEIMGAFAVRYEYADLYAALSGKIVGDFRTDNFGDMLASDPRIKNHLLKTWSGYYADNTLDSYTVFSFDLAYNFRNVISLQNFRIHARVNNLFNSLYAAGGEGKEFFPAAERNFYLGIDIIM